MREFTITANGATVKAKNNYYEFARYFRTTDKYLTDVYQNPSAAKARAYRDCVHYMRECEGVELRIVSHTCQFFTVAYLVEAVDSATGETVNLLKVNTGRNIYYYYEDMEG